MRNNSVVIASNAIFLAGVLRGLLSEAGFLVLLAANSEELKEKMRFSPRFVFIENSFDECGTDLFIQGIVRRNRHLRFVVWSAAELRPSHAARFIAAGAESFFSLRDAKNSIEKIINQIAEGRRYCPDDVKAVLESDRDLPIAGEKLTDREIQILRLTSKGKSRPEIMKILSLKLATVKYHRGNIYRKCGGDKPVEMLMNALTMRLVDLNDLE